MKSLKNATNRAKQVFRKIALEELATLNFRICLHFFPNIFLDFIVFFFSFFKIVWKTKEVAPKWHSHLIQNGFTLTLLFLVCDLYYTLFYTLYFVVFRGMAKIYWQEKDEVYETAVIQWKERRGVSHQLKYWEKHPMLFCWQTEKRTMLMEDTKSISALHS